MCVSVCVRTLSVAKIQRVEVLSKCHQHRNPWQIYRTLLMGVHTQSSARSQLDKLHQLRPRYTQSTVICPFKPPGRAVFEEAGSFHECTYTRAASNISRPPHIPAVISFKNTHSACFCPPPPLVVCADAKKVSSDNARTLSALNNLRYICCHPDVKQKKKSLEMMPKCKSRKFPSAGVFQGVIDYSSGLVDGKSESSQI